MKSVTKTTEEIVCNVNVCMRVCSVTVRASIAKHQSGNQEIPGSIPSYATYSLE